MVPPDRPAPQRPPLSLALWRVLQFGIDLTLVAVLCYVPTLLMSALPRNPDGQPASYVLALLVLLLILVAALAINAWYWVIRPLRRGGQTFAMQLLNLRVVAIDGRPATASQLALRALMLIVDGMLMGLVGLGSMLGTERRQRLGDVMADTIVQRVDLGATGDPDTTAGVDRGATRDPDTAERGSVERGRQGT